MSDDDLHLHSAQIQIARILRDLEKRLNAEVESIGLTEIDITTAGAPSRAYLKSVEIRMRRQVATRWATAE